MGPSYTGGNMQKRVLLVVILALVLSGCAPQGKEISLTDAAIDSASVTDETVFDEELKDNIEESSKGDLAPAEEVIKKPASIFVYVCGAVEKPGVYELFEGGRVVDAVEAAGGFLETADKTYVNLAALLDDGIKLYIPTMQETMESAALQVETFDKESTSLGSDSAGAGSGLININSATRDELTALPGIGNATAEKIISYREQHGAFKAIEDIMNVSGIKDKLFSKIKDHITV